MKEPRVDKERHLTNPGAVLLKLTGGNIRYIAAGIATTNGRTMAKLEGIYPGKDHVCRLIAQGSTGKEVTSGEVNLDVEEK